MLAATVACGLMLISCFKDDTPVGTSVDTPVITPVIEEEGYSISDEEFAAFNGKEIESGEMTTQAILWTCRLTTTSSTPTTPRAN